MGREAVEAKPENATRTVKGDAEMDGHEVVKLHTSPKKEHTLQALLPAKHRSWLDEAFTCIAWVGISSAGFANTGFASAGRKALRAHAHKLRPTRFWRQKAVLTRRV